MKIHVIHENADWSAPLFAALERRDLPFEDWFIHQGQVPVAEAPPQGVFYNRMSASSHTRDHRYAPELTAATLFWLESHGRRVLNSARSLNLELSKAAQYAELARFDIPTPRTIACVGRQAIVDAVATFDGPVILKPNRAGKGAGVALFREHTAVAAHLDSDAYEPPVDGITLIQDYIEPPEAFITRVEFVGQRFMYAVRVDTSEGFELCPADHCAIETACPTQERAKFEIVKGFDHPLIDNYQRFMKANDIHIAACEHVLDADGNAYTYDVNMNVNYNSDAEAFAGVSGMDAIAKYLGEELSACSRGTT